MSSVSAYTCHLGVEVLSYEEDGSVSWRDLPDHLSELADIKRQSLKALSWMKSLLTMASCSLEEAQKKKEKKRKKQLSTIRSLPYLGRFVASYPSCF